MRVAGEPRILELTAPDGGLSARFATRAGMVGCSLCHHGAELLGLRGGLDAYVSSGKTFGIPLLYPWANRLGDWSYAVAGREVTLDRDSPLLRADEHGLPIHGALAASPAWQARAEGPSRLAAELDFAAHPELLAVFPFPHRLELAIELGVGRLTITTTVVAGGDGPVPLSFGFHPYLSPPGAPRADWHVELPVRTHFALDARGLPTGETRQQPAEAFALRERTFDDLYALTGAGRFSVAAAGRRIAVEMVSGYPYAQVFAPLNQPVICFEPMTAPVDALRSHDGLRLASPGQPASATFSIAVESSLE
jgi:galactose mutarotase-like enzyme